MGSGRRNRRALAPAGDVTARRRSLLKAAAAGALAAALPAPVLVRRGSAAEPITVMTGFGLLPNFIEIMNAASGGHFAHQGLDARVIGATGTAREMQQIVAGEAQFGRVAALDQINAVARQAVPLVAVATICQGSAFQLVSPKQAPIRSAEDLKGKTVGIVSVGGSTDIFLDLILAKAGLPPDAVERQVTGDNPGALELARRGRVDCFLCSLNVVVALERSGAAIAYWSTDRYAPMPGQVYQTTRRIIEERPDLVGRFLRAMKASVDELLTQPLAPIFARAARDYDIPGLHDMATVVAVQQATAERLWLAQGRANLLRNVPDLWASGVAALRSAGRPVPADPAVLYTNRFVDAALKG